jgi:hypothetical protein
MRRAFLRWRGAEFLVYRHDEPERWELRVIPIWRRGRRILRVARGWVRRSFAAATHLPRRSH